MSESASADDAAEHQAIASQINLIREELQKASPDAEVIFELLERLLEMTKAHFKHEGSSRNFVGEFEGGYGRSA